MQQKEAVIHVNIADGGTGLIVGSQIRQFIVITESFARMTRTDTAGNIYLLADDILPYLVKFEVLEEEKKRVKPTTE